MPPSTRPPGRLRRETAETLVALVARGRQRVRLIAPFVDAWATELLALPLAAATARDVYVEVFLPSPSRLESKDYILDSLRRTVVAKGRTEVFRIIHPDPTGPWPHLKVVTVDGNYAYVGSANLTAAGLGSNVEMGVLVTGPEVAVLDATLDLITEGGTLSEDAASGGN